MACSKCKKKGHNANNSKYHRQGKKKAKNAVSDEDKRTLIRKKLKSARDKVVEADKLLTQAFRLSPGVLSTNKFKKVQKASTKVSDAVDFVRDAARNV